MSTENKHLLFVSCIILGIGGLTFVVLYAFAPKAAVKTTGATASGFPINLNQNSPLVLKIQNAGAADPFMPQTGVLDQITVNEITSAMNDAGLSFQVPPITSQAQVNQIISAVSAYAPGQTNG